MEEETTINKIRKMSRIEDSDKFGSDKTPRRGIGCVEKCDNCILIGLLGKSFLRVLNKDRSLGKNELDFFKK